MAKRLYLTVWNMAKNKGISDSLEHGKKAIPDKLEHGKNKTIRESLEHRKN